MDVLTHYLLPFLGVLFGLIVLHEAGHYVTAKMFGVKVLEAGIGLPPRLFGFRWRETDYTVNALPLGAFVRMLGEEDPSDPESLAAQPKWKRTIIIGSGAFLNVLVAIILFAIGIMIPSTVSDAGARIGEVLPNTPAANAGLQAGDEIVSVNGREVHNQQDAVYFVRLHQGSHVDIKVKRTDARTGSEIITFEDVYARWDPPEFVDECGIRQSQGMTGIVLGPARTFAVSRTPEERAELQRDSRKAYGEYKEKVAPGSPASCYSPSEFGYDALTAAECSALPPEEQQAARALKTELFAEASAECYVFSPPTALEVPTRSVSEPPWTALKDGSRLAFESIILTRNQIWSLVRGFGGSPVTGPIGIAQATGEIVERAGWRYLIEFSASISMSLGILNFLPLPMVDGGRLAFIFVEFIRRGKRIAPQKEALVHLAGFAMMILLFLIISYFDIARIARGDSLLQ